MFSEERVAESFILWSKCQQCSCCFISIARITAYERGRQLFNRRFGLLYKHTISYTIKINAGTQIDRPSRILSCLIDLSGMLPAHKCGQCARGWIAMHVELHACTCRHCPSTLQVSSYARDKPRDTHRDPRSLYAGSSLIFKLPRA